MSNRSLARKNRFKYRTLRKTYFIFKPWIVAMGGVDKLNANGRSYNMFPKLGENRYLSKEGEEAIRVLRSGGLKRGEMAHPQSFSISSKYDPDLVVPFTADVPEFGEVGAFAKQLMEAYGASHNVDIPPIWGGGDPLDFISKDVVSVGNNDVASHDLHAVTSTVKLVEETRKSKLKAAIKVTSQYLDSFPDTYHEDFLSDDIRVFVGGGIELVPKTDPMFVIALCSVISNPQQTEILFERGIVSTYVSFGNSVDPKAVEYREFVVHKPDAYTWKPEYAIPKNRTTSSDDKHIFFTPSYNPMLDLESTREIEIELKPWK